MRFSNLWAQASLLLSLTDRSYWLVRSLRSFGEKMGEARDFWSGLLDAYLSWEGAEDRRDDLASGDPFLRDLMLSRLADPPILIGFIRILG